MAVRRRRTQCAGAIRMSPGTLRFLLTGAGEMPDYAEEIWQRFQPLILRSWRFAFPHSRPWAWWALTQEYDDTIPENEAAILHELGEDDTGEGSGESLEEFTTKLGRYLAIIEFAPGNGVMSRIRGSNEG